jgi:hypothetical protein
MTRSKAALAAFTGCLILQTTAAWALDVRADLISNYRAYLAKGFPDWQARECAADATALLFYGTEQPQTAFAARQQRADIDAAKGRFNEQGCSE